MDQYRNTDAESTIAFGEEKKLILKSEVKVSKENMEIAFTTDIQVPCAQDMKIVSFTALDKITSVVTQAFLVQQTFRIRNNFEHGCQHINFSNYVWDCSRQSGEVYKRYGRIQK